MVPAAALPGTGEVVQLIVNIQDDILKIHRMGLLDRLLADKTTKKNILWATGAYAAAGVRYGRDQQITSDLITGMNSHIVKTRARKEMEQQSERTRQHGEVFTPLWVCKRMNDHADEAWAQAGPEDWKKYVDSRRLEIACGEAPYLVSRYDVETGEVIPVPERVGLLDRKLRAVNKNAQNEAEWMEWAFRAFRASYGFEFQGDNVLIARVNLMMSFEEYMQERWKRKPRKVEYAKLANIIAWNIWQMDGLTGAVPCLTPEAERWQIDFLELLGAAPEDSQGKEPPHCLVHNWLGGGSAEYLSLPTRGKKAMKFDFVIGNPPYQDDTIGDNKTFAPPIYHLFLNSAYQVSDVVEMIHPARFLFNAGTTPKQWNQDMLEDPHLKVLYYEPDSRKVFGNTEVKGGIAITYHDMNQTYRPIGIFTAYPELNSILQKVRQAGGPSMSDIVITRTAYRLTDAMHRDHPEAMDPYDMSTNIFDRLPQIFFDDEPGDGARYIRMLGRENNRRVYKYIRADYVNRIDSLGRYKVFLPSANGNGTLGEVLSGPVIGAPFVGATETFVSIGGFDTEEAALAARKYISTKFARVLLGVLKVTQHITPEKWTYVPLQSFGPDADIDWSASVREIDRQLYAKYGLDEKETAFVEDHVKEME